MAVDLVRKRLLVAALGNGNLEVVDLPCRHRIKQVAGSHEPAGCGLREETESCDRCQRRRWFDAVFPWRRSRTRRQLALGSDADNVRIDPRTGNAIVGLGSGGLATIDPEKRSKIGDIKLATHPESFQLDPIYSGYSSMCPMPVRSRWSTSQRQDRWRAGRRRVCGRISRSQSTVRARLLP